MKNDFLKKPRLAVYMLLIVLILPLFTLQGQALSYIEKNSVQLLALDSKEVEGVVELSGKTNKTQIKIMVTKDKYQEWYDIDLIDGKFNEEIWLTEGKGNYSISIMVHEKDREYSFGPKLTLKNTSEVNKFLVPKKHVESNDEQITSLAMEITKTFEKDIDKARAIYDWVKENIQYDYEKYSKHLNNNYNNDYGALNTLKSNKGVCYDFATLTAALGRAVGLQTKVVDGNGINGSFEGYHAWNEIYITDEDRWLKLDVTFAVTNKHDFFDNKNFDENHIKWSEY